MTQEIQPILTAVFVDYDNIYLSLKKRSEDAAKRFAKDAAGWIKEIENGRLITATNGPAVDRPRRIVLNRCYGNPVPRRNTHDNSTDMSSFPFVRHHFLRAGFEIIDCPPLTAQLKNSSDIKMVMDVRDFLNHKTRFEEFIILSGDADFTPVLHRLRAHNRRTVIFANDFTAAPYTALSDGEVKETSLLATLLEGKIAAEPERPAIAPDTSGLDRIRADVIGTVVSAVRAAGGPVPLEALAERTTRQLGHERTVGTGWAGAGSFLDLLRKGLPQDILLTDQPPYLAYEASRTIAQPQPPAQIGGRQQRIEPSLTPPPQQRALPAAGVPFAQPMGLAPIAQPVRPEPIPVATHYVPAPSQPQPPPIPANHIPAAQVAPAPQPILPQPPSQQQIAQQQRQAEAATAIQQSIARIHDACQAPPLSPPEYRALFEIMAREITEAGLQGAQTLSNIHARATEASIKLSRDDVRFIMEVVSEADPWFEQGASANLFAGRFRNFVVARCRSQGLNLSSDELDLIEAWFAGTGQPMPPQSVRVPAITTEIGQGAPQRQIQPPAQPGNIWAEQPGEEFPKILRTRLRG